MSIWEYGWFPASGWSLHPHEMTEPWGQREHLISLEVEVGGWEKMLAENDCGFFSSN